MASVRLLREREIIFIGTPNLCSPHHRHRPTVILPKMFTFLDNQDKKNRCMIEMITVVHVGMHLKAGGTQLEGDGFEFITAYDTLVAMGEHLNESMSSFELMSELLQVVEVNGGADDASQY